MIILHLSGGLGNQMFQYSFGRATAKRLGVELKLDLSDSTLKIHNGFELKRLFNTSASEATYTDIKSILGFQRFNIVRNLIKFARLEKQLNSVIVQEQHFNFSPLMLSIRDNSYINGYWQSEKYFSEFENEIRNEFTFKQALSKKNDELAVKISNLNSVSLHIRRNDYANNLKIKAIHGLCSLEYYHSAVQHIAERIENPYFFIFSDDPDWVRKNLQINYCSEIVEHNRGSESYNDMRLMSYCRHHIIANSSFSWWGAWLNPRSDKIVISPKSWFVNGTDTKSLIPKNWFQL